MIILGLDPGTTESALVWYAPRSQKVSASSYLPNQDVLTALAYYGPKNYLNVALVIEKIEAMGMAVGASTFETVFWAGRFAQAFGEGFQQVTRRQVKLHLCGNMRAKDANVRQALLDKFPGGVGTKKAPGPLFGISAHKWSALAVAVTYWETRHELSQPENARSTTNAF